MVNVFGNTDFQKREKKKRRRFSHDASGCWHYLSASSTHAMSFLMLMISPITMAPTAVEARTTFPRSLKEIVICTLHPYVFEVLACWDHTSLVRMDSFGSSILLFTCLPFLFYFNQIVYRFVFAKYGYNNSLKTVF